MMTFDCVGLEGHVKRAGKSSVFRQSDIQP